MKISIVGASGSVGQEIARTILTNASIQFEKLYLFTHSSEGRNSVTGMIYDMEIGNLEQKITITDKQEELKYSDIIVICAGTAVSTNIVNIEESSRNNANNRNLLYSVNREIVLQWIRYVSIFAPKALVVLVTNPVSKLLSDIHFEYPHIVAVGCGVTNDTLRVRNELIKEYPDIDVTYCYVIGSHDVNAQTVALTYLNQYYKNDLSRDSFEFLFKDAEEKKIYTSRLKNEQNQLIQQGQISMYMYKDFPILYRSYFNHRLAHFLYKTHISTAMAVMDIISAYNNATQRVSVEVFNPEYNRITGVPVSLYKGFIMYQEIPYDTYEEEILRNC